MYVCHPPCTPAVVHCSEEQGAVAAQDDGHERITVTLRKPMGMVLAEGKSGEVRILLPQQQQRQQHALQTLPAPSNLKIPNMIALTPNQYDCRCLWSPSLRVAMRPRKAVSR
jgi:hypothetical protein